MKRAGKDQDTSWVWEAIRQLAQVSAGVEALGTDLASERPLIPVRKYKLTGIPGDDCLQDMLRSLQDVMAYKGEVYAGNGYLEAWLYGPDPQDEREDMTLVYKLTWPRRA